MLTIALGLSPWYRRLMVLGQQEYMQRSPQLSQSYEKLAAVTVQLWNIYDYV
jgi:hypothetical protein